MSTPFSGQHSWTASAKVIEKWIWKNELDLLEHLKHNCLIPKMLFEEQGVLWIIFIPSTSDPKRIFGLYQIVVC